MKKSLFVLVVAALGLAPKVVFAQSSGFATPPGVQQAVSVLPTSAPQNRADGVNGPQLADREGNTKAVLGHAEYTEPSRRGKLFTLQNAAYTIVAQNATGGAIGTAKPIVGFYNPNGSGVNAVVINAKAFHTSGTTGGPLMWNFYCGVNWTSVSSGTVYGAYLSNVTPNGSSMIPQVNQNLNTTPAITTAMNVLGVFGGPDSTALSSGGEAGHTEDIKGGITVPPGCAIGLFSTATGSSDVLSASMEWEEVAQ